MEEMKENMEELKQDGNSIPIERNETKSESDKAEGHESAVNEKKEDEGKKNDDTELYKEKIASLEKQVNELKDSLLRRVAEFENYKRRSEIEQSNLLKYAAEPFVKNILSVFDDFERSMNHIDDEGNFESTKKGLQLLFEKFNKILEAQGVKKIEAKGRPFDVELHEALMQQPVEGVEPHTVLDVIEPGYLFKDKVIRHAKVIVSAELASPENNSNNE